MKFDKISILFVPQFHFLQFSFKEREWGVIVVEHFWWTNNMIHQEKFCLCIHTSFNCERASTKKSYKFIYAKAFKRSDEIYKFWRENLFGGIFQDRFTNLMLFFLLLREMYWISLMFKYSEFKSGRINMENLFKLCVNSICDGNMYFISVSSWCWSWNFAKISTKSNYRISLNNHNNTVETACYTQTYLFSNFKHIFTYYVCLYICFENNRM